MIKELMKGFISVPIDLYNSITPCFYLLGKIVGVILFIFIIVVLIDIIFHILGLDKFNNDFYDPFV